MTEIPTAGSLKRTRSMTSTARRARKMVPFGGWDMPVQYTGIIEEHRAVRARRRALRHQPHGRVRGRGARRRSPPSSALTTNDASTLAVGQVQYSLLCYPEGGIVDDLTLYRLADDRYMLTVNASNIDKDWAWVTGARRRRAAGRT